MRPLLRLLVACVLATASLATSAETAPQPVRVVATGGRIGYTFYTLPAGNTVFRQRSPHVLGGPVAEIQIGFMDWMYPTSSAETPNDTNDVTLTHVWLERASTGQVLPITFSGSRQLVLPKNSTTPVWLSDPLPSSAWTGATPARDEIFWLNVRGTVPEGGKIPVGTPASYGGSSGSRFAAYPLSNDPGAVDTAGAVPTISGWTTRVEGVPLVFLGRYTGPGHLSVIGIGDSILHGSGDAANPTATIAGYGFFNRAALDANGKNTLATFNLTRHGQTASSFITPSRQTRQTPFLKYANVVVEEYGTNDLGQAGTGDPATILARVETIWSIARAQGVQKIVRTTLMPRTTSTDAWRTLAAQTPNTGWESGGKRDTINAGLQAALAAKKIDVLVDCLAVVGDPTDPSRWLTNGAANYVTSDGTHVSPGGNALLGTALRTALLSLSVDDYPAWSAAISWGAADSAPAADPDGDGRANLLEYAFDTNPLSPDGASSTQSRVSDSKLELSFPRLRHDLTYVVQASSDLATWTAIATNPGTLGETVTATDTLALADTPRRFLRLLVSR